jgi:4-amino-4-deoxy-L-arabinose transferase-like glycosyltransferase
MKGGNRMSTKRWLWVILGLTLILKIIIVLQSGATYDLNSDDRSYLTTAQLWLDTGMFSYNDPERPTVFITPGFPAFLALFMKIMGPGLALENTIRIVQAMMVTGGLYMIFVIGKRLFSERAAFWGTVLAALYPPMWLMSNFILTEAMFFLFVTLLVYTALRAMETPTTQWALLFGLTWVATIYVRPTIALWPGIFFLLLMFWRKIPRKQLFKCGGIVALVLIVCLLPWWVRNYHISGGQFIALTKSGGNPLLLGTFPYGLPSIEEQRTWHATNNLWVNDAFDNKWAKERIADGFHDAFWTYLSWYTIGKFGKFWGDVFYWMPIWGIPKAIVYLYHMVLVIAGFIGMWFARKNRGAMAIVALLAYMSVLHMIYLAHGRYSAPLMPFVALFAAYLFDRLARLRENKRKAA